MRKLRFTVTIEGKDNGYAVNVGCREFVFSYGQLDVLIEDLEELLGGNIKQLMEKYDVKEINEDYAAQVPMGDIASLYTFTTQDKIS